MSHDARPHADEATAAAPRVLLVDDDEVNLMLTAIALRDRGFAITEAAGGEQALRILAHFAPDVIVLDALMPGMDGFQTCEALRSMPAFENIPVLMLTGLDDEASINRAYQAGATDFFVKSTQWSLLAGRLRYLLRASRLRLELERSKARLARAQDLAKMGSFDWRRGADGVGGVLVMSPEGLRVFGYGPGERPMLHALLRLVPVETRRSFVRLLRGVLTHSSVLATDLPVTLPDGRHRIIHVEAEPEYNEHGQSIGYTGIVQDVTDRRAAEDHIRRLANFDPLTGLPNRHQLIWRTERALQHARRMGHSVALLLIDLDRFKNINDTLGHTAGDELLIEVARRLRGCVRHSDQVLEGAVEAVGPAWHRKLEAVGRLGGDEFVALLPEVGDERDAERVAQRMLDVMREPIFVGGGEWVVTASIGIAMFPRDGQTVADLMRNSDVAMYAVKDQGKNAAAVYSPLLMGRGRERLELESALHKAIERDELVLHYQPKVDVRSARVVGVEALMRWQRGGTLVSPADFIPLAEETGLIVPMSEWLLREAARQARAWQDALGQPLSIAVNMPTRIFERSDLVDRIHDALALHGVAPSTLLLEITESNLMKNLQDVIPSLHRLNEVGVEVSIDDFGTGYSSLAYLGTLPISEVKIDKAFVRELGVAPKGAAVIAAIIALGRALGLRVIAEGVESLRQMDELHRLGCSLMQGYQFSRPVPAAELEGWLRSAVLPRKAPPFGAAGDADATDAKRAGGARA
ncbi:putative bifunctional diguanylate cyclase/phosphodiesterase [Azohydromonas sediminis]|uniref:putative bifunctional diguanylate cyclase/phosphodiesterase n=1 Tax=Azohydromonas sediminis TaxID=2259674 RepID=UPI000E655C42|nr:EAL domain-containing protein [Azohydromonas sediminis]